MPPKRERNTVSRRDFLREGVRSAGLLVFGGALGWLATRAAHGGTVWQIDPNKCMQCGKCSTACVLHPSAVKCVHSYAMCGYCQLCTGFFTPDANALNTGAENQQCPTGAIQRTFIEDPFYQYIINEQRCNGCGRCVQGCTAFGNGSLFLQIRHDRCLHCNACAIADVCPAQAITRVPAEHPYLLKERSEVE